MFTHPVTERRHRGMLTQIGISGFEFRLDEPINDIAGAVISKVRIQVGDCALLGDIVVKNVRKSDDDSAFYGGLFLPASRETALRLEGIVHGLDVAAEIRD